MQHAVADERVLLHHLVFLRRQLAGLEQDVVRDADLADVVHGGGDLDQFAAFFRQAQTRGDQAREFRHAQHVVAGVRVAVFTRLGQTIQSLPFTFLDLPGGGDHRLFQ